MSSSQDVMRLRQAMGPPAPVAPAKRSDAEMEDVQFISSKPVKRQKVDHPTDSPIVNTTHVQTIQLQPPPNSQPVPQSQPVPHLVCGSSLITPISVAPIADNDMSWPNSEINSSHDRRITTGMVGLPSGFSDWESIFGYRGCSLPELESYSMSAAARLKSPKLSSPAISPKQIPNTIASKDSQPEPAPSERNDMLQGNPTLRSGSNPSMTAVMNTPASQETAKPNATDPTIVQQKEIVPVAFEGCAEKVVDSTQPIAQQTPHDSSPEQIQQQQMPSEQPTTTPDNVTQAHAGKQPCKACTQMQQRAAFARAQGLPFTNTNMPLRMLPPGPYHQPFGPQANPQFMSALQAGMHSFGPGFSPMMVPMNMQNYSGAAMSPPVLAHQHAVQPMPPRPTAAKTAAYQQPSTGKTSEAGRENAVAAATTPTRISSQSPAQQARPQLLPSQHPFLMQPNYRKPSPNLIADVAETCQEKFPFEEVAKRHDTTVEKVADVFAAIIQVPLLRCPKDRRRAGRLAHERVKEYNKTKRELQEAAAAAKGQMGNRNNNSTYRGDGQQGAIQPQIVVRPLDVANALGPTE
ncbi:uncharacterized protein PG986_005379 [Apiospora aurea]|uniref:Uncharacterized protein n=1 Tax=Apiospora aurea TaxID=335848 RepID=A0ABR1QI76_9PEZI